MMVQEERSRQIMSAARSGVAAGNAYSASRAGYGNYTTPGGRTGTFSSPTAAVIAIAKHADSKNPPPDGLDLV